MEPAGKYGCTVIQPQVLWPSLSGALFLLVGLGLARREWSAASGLEKLVALGPVFVAAPLATFGAEHFALAQSMREMVPVWMPARLFWVYFVGVALFAAAGSLIVRRQMRLSTALLSVMFLLFVAMVHVPGALAHPGDRFPWTVALRETAFAGGALAFAAAQIAVSTDARRAPGTSLLVTLGRAMVLVPLLFFACEHFLHPEGALGIPLRKATPLWFPGRLALGYLTGIALLVLTGATFVARYARTAAAWLGLLFTALTVLVYVPILAAASSSALLEGVNYVMDTLLFAGTVLLLSSALPAPTAIPSGP